jgi:pyrimidine deaminase RibD-like protein
MTQFEIRQFMELAIEQMRQSVVENRVDGKATPKVGAVLVSEDGKLIGSAFRGELRQGDHAEYTLLDRKLRDQNLTGHILFATLEPCAHGARKSPKVECAQRIVNARIRTVYIGIEDPDPTVATKGIRFLQDAGVQIVMFDKDLQDIIEHENAQFLKEATIRAKEVRLPAPIMLTELEKKISSATIDEFDDTALQLYIEKVGLKLNNNSPHFLSLLNQLELIKREKKTISKTTQQDEYRRVDVMPRFRYSGGLVSRGMEDKFRNEGDRANIISFQELDENDSYIDIPLGWINKGQEFKIVARPKGSVENNNQLGYHIEIRFTDKDGREYKQEIFHRGNKSINLPDAELVRLENYNISYRPTGLGIILFGRKPRNRFPQAGLKVEIRYGIDEPELHDLDLALVLIPDRVEELLKKALRANISRESFSRQTQYEIPLQVLREAIINALVHRDYEIAGAKTYLIIDPEKIVVKSPGMPIPPIKFEDFQQFKAPSLSRNPKLVAVFNAMNFVEERGIGMTSMKSLQSDYGLPLPVITFENPYVVITFTRAKI